MIKVKYLILGAGPAGLTVANRLMQMGESNFIVAEKENEAGGLCRSVIVDGAPFDIGGGHFLDVRRPRVTEFLFQFMPQDEWKLYDRKSVIDLQGKYIEHPLEANIWQLDMDKQVEYLVSIAKAGSNIGEERPLYFKEWIRWKLGDRIAEDYMLPYNEKMFSDDLDDLGTYWLDKLPSVSFEETIRSCLEKKSYGKQPGHAQFYYPTKYGYGELWLRMAQAVKGKILYGIEAKSIDFDEKIVEFADGREIQAEKIITTIPWSSLSGFKGMPSEMVNSIKQLKHSAIVTSYVPNNLETDAQWIYIPDKSVPYHRILVRHNFCTGSRGYWTETRKELAKNSGNFSYVNEYAYPLNTINKTNIIGNLLQFAQSRDVYGLGRWGEHSHYNSDLVVEKGMQLAERLAV